MGSKMKSLGLSSLVVTSLDKGAAIELEASGWKISDNPLKFHASSYHVSDTSVAGRSVAKILTSAKTPLTKEDGSISIKWPSMSAFVKKASTGWRKRWNKRLLMLNEDGVSLFKSEAAKKPYKSIKGVDIMRVERTKASSESGGLEFVITFRIKEGKTEAVDSWTFEAGSQTELIEWRSSISTYALVDEISTATPPKSHTRIQHFITDCGAQLEYMVSDDVSLAFFALIKNRKDVLSLLLRKGVDARFLLRLDRRVRTSLTPSQVVNMLESTGRDLNLIGDDDECTSSGSDKSFCGDGGEDGCWSLLHHFVATRDVDNIIRLVQRIDRPTLNLKTRAGETAMTMAMRRIDEQDDSQSNVKKAIEIVKLLLEHGADPNHRSSTGDNAFHIACKRSPQIGGTAFNLLVTQSLLDVNKLDASGDAPLHVLIKLGQIQLAKRLVHDPRIDLSIRDSSKLSSLVLAMMTNEESFACFILSRGADASQLCTAVNEDAIKAYPSMSSSSAAVSEEELTLAEDYPIHLAIKLHMTSLALKLVESLSCDALNKRDCRGHTPLILSVLHSLLGVSHAIVTKFNEDSHRNSLNEHDAKTGDTALQLAIRAGRVELTHALLEAGADIGERNFIGETGLHACAKFVERTYNSSGGYTALKLFSRMIEMDTKRGAASCINVLTLPVDKVPQHMQSCARRIAKNSRDGVGAQGLLHQAAACPSEQCGLWLLDAILKSPVVSLENLDGAGLTPLACGIEAQNAEICKLLLGRTTVNRMVNFGRESYLHLVIKQTGVQGARAEALLPVLSMLLAHGAFCGYWDDAGLTPLHIACGSDKFLPALRLLLADADVLAHRLDDRAELTGLTPLMIAVQKSRSPKIVDLLLEAGSDVRLREPKSRRGVFQMCLEEGFDASPDNVAISVKMLQRVPESLLITGDEEWRARRNLMEKHAALVSATDEMGNSNSEVKMDESTQSPRHVGHPPFVLLNERFLPKQLSKDAIANRPKRAMEGPENDDVFNRENTSKRQPPISTKPPPHELDQKESENEDGALSLSDDDDDFAQVNSKQTKAVCHRLSQLDRIFAMERIRIEAMENANAWLDSDSGKNMISQVASVLISETEEYITHEAAVALARRNFIEEQVRDGLAQFEATFDARHDEGVSVADEKAESL